MGTEIIERENLLRAQVEGLTVQIDRGRVNEQVAQITDSDYFRDLKARADELRRRER